MCNNIAKYGLPYTMCNNLLVDLGLHYITCNNFLRNRDYIYDFYRGMGNILYRMRNTTD